MPNYKSEIRGLLKFYAYICAHFQGANEFYPNSHSFRRFSVWPVGVRWRMKKGGLKKGEMQWRERGYEEEH